MKITVIAPITNQKFVSDTPLVYAEKARPDTTIKAVWLDKGPASVESQYEDAVAAPQVVQRSIQAEQEGADAVIIDCMNDPGLQPAREAVKIPVVGAAQSAMLMASILAHKFSVVSTAARDVYPVELLVRRYGLKEKYASTRWVDIPVLELHLDDDRLLEELVTASARAVREDGAHAIVFGCTGMKGMAGMVQERLQAQGLDVIVIDPSLAALKWAEILVGLEMSQSRRTYALLDRTLFPEITAAGSMAGLEARGQLDNAAKIQILEPVIAGFRSEDWLDPLLEEYQGFARTDTRMAVSAIRSGPATVETLYGETLAVPEMLRLTREAERDGATAGVIDCMCDPSLDPAREVASIPIVGPSQTSAFLAASIAHRFSYLGTGDDMRSSFTNQLEEYGISSKAASVRTTGLSVEEVETDPQALFEALLREAEAAILEDGAHCLVLGCTGMAGVARKLQEALYGKGLLVQVIEPMRAAIKMAEALSDLGWAHSKMTYPLPPKKALPGYPELEI